MSPASGSFPQASAGTLAQQPAGGTPASGGAAAASPVGAGGSLAAGSSVGAAGHGASGDDAGMGSAGQPAHAGTSANAGSNGSAGVTAGSAGSVGAAGSAGSAANSGMPTATCAAGKRNDNAFGCNFAWGTNDPGGSLSALQGLSFVSKWVGYEVDKSGTLPKCDGCTWLSSQLASTALLPVYYAYFIGYFGHANGFMDGNQNPNGPNLTTDAANLIRDHRAQIIDMYSSYAKQSAAVWRDKPLVWLLEGDFVQYAGDSQKNKLSYTELGQLAVDITCAIKSQMPNAVVAINQSTWNSDDVTNTFWDAMAAANYDMVWTTGVAGNQGFFQADTNSSSYNQATANYAYVHHKTGRSIFVDTSFGISAMSDSWSTADTATLNARIADGVVAVDVTTAPINYESTANALEPKLQTTCK